MPVQPECLSQLPPEEADRVDSLCREFEAEWDAWPGGAPPDPAAYLARYTGPHSRVLLGELLGEDVEQRRARRLRVSRAEYEDRFPGHADLIAAALGWPSVPGYEVLSELGRGGMGIVCEARRVSDGRRVALKTVLSGLEGNAAALARFRNERDTLASLDHPHIVRVLEVGEGDGRPWFAMELYEQGSLADHPAGPRLPDVPGFLAMLARAVDYLHQRGFLHPGHHGDDGLVPDDYGNRPDRARLRL
jgi:hypothetical protein